MLHATSNERLQESIRRLRCGFMQENCEKLFNVLRADELTGAVAEEVGGWRERIYSPVLTLRLFVEQALHADHACQDVVVRHAVERTARGLVQASLSSGPYCRARQRLPLSLLGRVSTLVGWRLEEASPAVWRWRGRPVKLIDGTTVSMPDTLANQQAYPQHGEQKRGLGSPLARLVALISLGSGAVLDWAMGPCKGKGTGEDALLRQILGALNAGDLLLGDRYHCSFITVWLLQRLGVDIVMRQHGGRVTDFRRGVRLGKRDHLVSWKRPPRPEWLEQEVYAQLPEQLVVREVQVAGWVLVSTLLNPRQVSRLEINALYALRWNIELDLRSIKCVMGMDILSCKSPQMVRKEVGAYLLAYNLIRAVMAQAAACARRWPRQLSFSAAKRIIISFQDLLMHHPAGKLTTMFAYVRGAIAALLLPYRPNRVEPRAVKRRPKPRRLLMVPRDIARARLERQRPVIA